MAKRKPSIALARAYGLSEQARGRRVLVDRIWPRGVKKEDLADCLWLKEAAPSNELRRWFGHRAQRWEEFRRRYTQELEANPSGLEELLALAKQGPLLLIYGARDEEHNQAVVLRDVLLEKLGQR